MTLTPIAIGEPRHARLQRYSAAGLRVRSSGSRTRQSYLYLYVQYELCSFEFVYNFVVFKMTCVTYLNPHGCTKRFVNIKWSDKEDAPVPTRPRAVPLPSPGRPPDVPPNDVHE